MSTKQNRDKQVQIKSKTEEILAVFDLDNTLAPLASPIRSEARELLFALSAAGVNLAIASGKPIYYLMGMCRQAGLSDVWLIGENGARLVYGVDLPPTQRFSLLSEFYENDRIPLACLGEIRRLACERFAERIWLQPNEVAVTFFFDSPKTQRELEDFFQFHERMLSAVGIQIFRHNDSFDLLPTGVDKGRAVLFLTSHLGQQVKEIKRIIAVGDSENDEPLFRVADEALALCYPESKEAGVHFKTFAALKAYLERQILCSKSTL